MGEIEGDKLPGLSSKKLLDLGFKFNNGVEDMYAGAIKCCKEKGFIWWGLSLVSSLVSHHGAKSMLTDFFRICYIAEPKAFQSGMMIQCLEDFWILKKLAERLFVILV